MPVTKRVIKLRQANAAGQQFIRVESKPGIKWTGCTSELPTSEGVQKIKFVTFTVENVVYLTPLIAGLPKFLTRDGRVTTRIRIAIDTTQLQPRIFVKYNKPCPMRNFKELSFEEFTQLYRAQQAGRSTTPPPPMESE